MTPKWFEGAPNVFWVEVKGSSGLCEIAEAPDQGKNRGADSLQFILTHHQTRHGWNSFVRICLALTLEPDLQQKALDNMRDGGKYKGLANLPDVQRINVRQEVADAAAYAEELQLVSVLPVLGHLT